MILSEMQVAMQRKRKKKLENQKFNFWIMEEHFFSSIGRCISSPDKLKICPFSVTFSIKRFNNGTLERVLHDPTIINFFCTSE